MPTKREELVEILRRDRYTARELADEIGVRVRDVVDHLEHLRQSYKGEFRVEPAECPKCGFIFETRKKLGTPSRCPRCKNERLTEPRYWVGGGL